MVERTHCHSHQSGPRGKIMVLTSSMQAQHEHLNHMHSGLVQGCHCPSSSCQQQCAHLRGRPLEGSKDAR